MDDDDEKAFDEGRLFKLILVGRGERERLWAEKIGSNTAKLCNEPVCFDDLHFGDEVTFQDNPDGPNLNPIVEVK